MLGRYARPPLGRLGLSREPSLGGGGPSRRHRPGRADQGLNHGLRRHRRGRNASASPSCRKSRHAPRRSRSSSPAPTSPLSSAARDAKITYFGATLEERMNGSCAGGTGAFIDQMASLLDTDPAGLNTPRLRRHDHLPHSLALRRIRQGRHPAPRQRGGSARGHRGERLPGGSQSDYLRPRLRAAPYGGASPSWAARCTTSQSSESASSSRSSSAPRIPSSPPTGASSSQSGRRSRPASAQTGTQAVR